MNDAHSMSLEVEPESRKLRQASAEARAVLGGAVQKLRAVLQDDPIVAETPVEAGAAMESAVKAIGAAFRCLDSANRALRPSAAPHPGGPTREQVPVQRTFSATWARGMTHLPEDLPRALRDPTPANRVTTWTRGPTTRTRSRTEAHPHVARPEWRNAPAHRRFRLGPGSDRACSRPICARTAYPSCQNAVPQGQDRPRNGKYYRLTSRHRSVNIGPCLVRPKNQFSLTRAALSTCRSAESSFLSVEIPSLKEHSLS